MRGVLLIGLVLATLVAGAGWWPARAPEPPLTGGSADAVDSPAPAATEPPLRGRLWQPIIFDLLKAPYILLLL
ncbi:MAG: hypothetical protein MK005_11720 [Alcanivorax sp.]|nr:hypothetical protein [Alcanivorax sp.]